MPFCSRICRVKLPNGQLADILTVGNIYVCVFMCVLKH